MNRRGFALVLTLISALVLLIVVIAVVSGLSISNRKVGANKSVELQAQYAAESGAEQSLTILGTVRDLFEHVNVDLGVRANRIAFAEAIYAFCHGDQRPSAVVLASIYDALDPHTGRSYTCTADASSLRRDLDGKTPEALGGSWLKLLTEFIDPAYYATKGIHDPARFWGQVIRGRGVLSRTLKHTSAYEIRYHLSSGIAGLTPYRARVGDGKAEFRFGNPALGATELYSIGVVEDANGRILAQRKVQIGNEGKSLLAFELFAPNFAWFAYFVHKQPRGWQSDPRRMVVFTNQNVIDGPVHFNDYLAFEKGSHPWFGGPVSSAGPELHPGQGMRVYWRETAAGHSGHEQPPAGVDGTHWWSFRNAEPEFAVKRDSLGNPICYDPTSREERLCATVDTDRDGTPDPPWIVARDVNFEHEKIPLPGRREVDAVRDEAIAGGIYIDGSKFRWVSPYIERNLGDPPPNELLGIYLNYRGNKGVKLEAQGDTQLITIYAERVAGFTERPRWRITWRYDCPPPPPGGGGGGGPPPPPPPPGGGGGTVESPFDLIFPLAFAEGEGDSYCSSVRKPPCGRCRCKYTCKKVYRIVRKTESITLKYTKTDHTLQVVSRDGDLEFLQLPSGTFNGLIFSDVNNFAIEGPGRDADDHPQPAIAEFAQLTVASSGSVLIKNDITYARPACNKFPHRDTADEDGDGDTTEVIDRCTDRDFEHAADNLFGVFAKDIRLFPRRSDQDLNVHGVLMAYDGSISTWNHRGQPDRGRFKLFGGMIQKRIGPIGYIDRYGRFHGYHTTAAYDRRMLHGLAPPGFKPFGNGRWSARPEERRTGNRGFWRQVPSE